MARQRGDSTPPTLPIVRGRKPKGPNQDNLDLVEMGLEALRRVGGVRYLETQARQRPKDFLAFLCRLAPLQIKADISNLEVVVHALTVAPQPTPGVLASPIAANVIQLHPREAAQHAADLLAEGAGNAQAPD